MAIPSRTAAQERVDGIQIFRLELNRLEHDGILALTEAQHLAVDEYHDSLRIRYAQTLDIDPNLHTKQLSLGMRIVSFLGALALAASVFFLFYQFWGLFPTATQVAVLLLASLGTFTATLLIQRKDSSGYFTKLAAMVAFACFVLNITMLSQIFNITPSDKALISWAVFAFILAYNFDLRLLLAAGIICLISFVSARMGTWGGMYWLDFGNRPENFFPAAAVLFFVPKFIQHQRFEEFPSLYRVFALLTFFLPVLVLGNWGETSYFDLDRKMIEDCYQVIGFVGSACVIWLGARRDWSEVVNTGVTFFVIFFYTKLYDWWWDIMPKYLFFMVLGLSAVLLLFVLRRMRTSTLKLIGENKS